MRTEKSRVHHSCVEVSGYEIDQSMEDGVLHFEEAERGGGMRRGVGG